MTRTCNFLTDAIAKIVDEQQANYDTTSDTEHMEPTPGPWEIDRFPAWEDQITSGDYTVATVHYGMAGKARANARLIAAAGTAVSELPDECDPVEAMRQLPKMLELLEMAMNGLRHFRGLCPEGRSAKDHEVIDRIKDVLDAAHKNTQTDA